MKLIEPPDGRPWALFAIAGGSLFLNVILGAALFLRPSAPAALDGAAVAQEFAAQEPVTVAVAVAEAEAEAELPEGYGELAVPAEAPEGVQVVRAEVKHSLARTFQGALDKDPDIVAAIYARLFVWDLDLRRDLQRGDEIVVAYSWKDDLAEIPVATYRSGKLGRTLTAYRFHKPGDAWPSWWDADGVEVPRRLIDSPIVAYEQVTSLLKDRPNHKGMDFKAPEGTDILSPRSGTVTRINWNTAYNGGCIEVKYDDGTLARFLHLQSTEVKPGQRVAAGARLGLSGNTGRSTAPHLHYELERNGRVLDPIEYHGVTRRSLAGADLEAFRAAVRAHDRLLVGDA